MNYVKVKSIKKVESEPVYHMTITHNSNFFANDLCVHNCDYRAEVKVILFNLGQSEFIVKNGDRIAQGVICPVIQMELTEVEELDETQRKGGFGSTGIK